MNDMKNELAWLESISVRFRPKSLEIFERVLMLTQLFEQLSEAEKSAFISQISEAMAKKLLSFSAFFSEIAMATHDAKWIRAALVLHLIEDFRKDYRENIRYLVLIKYGANFIEANFDQILQDVLRLASGKSRSHLVDFSGRDDEQNEINKFGIRVSSSEGELRFTQA